jgi:hypothetical protein
MKCYGLPVILGGRENADMASSKPLNDFFKVVVTFESRADGGLRAYSDDVPGFVLSHSDQTSLLRDIVPALEIILSSMFGEQIVVSELSRLHEPSAQVEHAIPPMKEYVTHRAVA